MSSNAQKFPHLSQTLIAKLDRLDAMQQDPAWPYSYRQYWQAEQIITSHCQAHLHYIDLESTDDIDS